VVSEGLERKKKGELERERADDEARSGAVESAVPFLSSTTPANLSLSSSGDQRYALDTPPSKYLERAKAMNQHFGGRQRWMQHPPTHISRYVSKASFIATSSSRRRSSGTWPSSIGGEY